MTVYLKTVCPHCGRVNHMQSDLVAHTSPENGDISICAECLKIGVFDDKVQDRVRKPTDDEWVKFMQDPNLSRGIKNLEAAKKLKDKLK